LAGKKRYQITDCIAGCVTYVIEGESEEDARNIAEKTSYSLGCLEDSRSDCIDVEEVPADTPLDEFEDSGDGFFGRYRLRRRFIEGLL